MDTFMLFCVRSSFVIVCVIGGNSLGDLICDMVSVGESPNAFRGFVFIVSSVLSVACSIPVIREVTWKCDCSRRK